MYITLNNCQRNRGFFSGSVEVEADGKKYRVRIVSEPTWEQTGAAALAKVWRHLTGLPAGYVTEIT